ncbi:MAG: hypothetical protein ACREJO_17535 [Phycisphaerales bacterium]
MFLPLLLMRDFGLASLAVFAAPNVLGAMTMGWVLRDGASERIVAAHRGMVRAFSAVTVAFQAFFLTWMLSWLGTNLLVLTISAVALSLVSSMARPSRSDAVTAGGGVAQWLISVGVLVVALVKGAIGSLPPNLPAASDELVPLAMVCLLGFGLCPYLDVTFHHARQRTSGATARGAFALGFGFFFLTMIAGTVGYSGAVSAVVGGGMKIGQVLLWVLGLHIGLQLLYTVRVHSERWAVAGRAWMVGAALVGVAIGLLATSSPGGLLARGGLTTAEVCYRVFMAFYGLVFPAYVWICMIPSRGGAAGRRARIVAAAAIALAAPCYWMGFIERQTWWLALGVAVVVIARVAVRPSPVG